MTTIPLGDPVHLGDVDVRLGFWGIARNPDDPPRVGGTFNLINGAGDLTLDVFIGPKGDPGEPMPPWRIQWDDTVENIGDLPNVATLDESDDGRAWVIGTNVYVYVHHLGGYRSIDAGIPGPTGRTPDVSFSAKLVEGNGTEIPVEPSGTELNPHFKLHIPMEMIRGPEGPPTSLRLAPDYDNTYPPLDGQGIVWDEESERFKPGDLSPTAATMITIPHSAFFDVSSSAGRSLICSYDLDPLPYAWYPDVLGHMRWRRWFLSTTECEIEVRIGDTGAGTGEIEELCGLGPYDPSTLDATTVANVMPHFSDTGFPTRSVAPDTATARVPIGVAKTLYVFIHKVGGYGGYEFTKNTAQLRLLQIPVS